MFEVLSSRVGENDEGSDEVKCDQDLRCGHRTTRGDRVEDARFDRVPVNSKTSNGHWDVHGDDHDEGEHHADRKLFPMLHVVLDGRKSRGAAKGENYHTEAEEKTLSAKMIITIF
jgi:hypothetical protein